MRKTRKLKRKRKKKSKKKIQKKRTLKMYQIVLLIKFT